MDWGEGGGCTRVTVDALDGDDGEPHCNGLTVAQEGTMSIHMARVVVADNCPSGSPTAKTTAGIGLCGVVRS